MTEKRSFLTASILSGDDWRGLELAVARLLAHAGWSDVQDVGQSGDKGADLLAVRLNQKTGKKESYLFQIKAVSGVNGVGVSAINQAVRGQAYYESKVVVIVTNGEFTGSSYRRRNELRKEGFDVRIWNGKFLSRIMDGLPDYSDGKKQLRNYQLSLASEIESRCLSGRRRSFFVVATGLGKTVIASSVTDALIKNGLDRVLVLCHSVDLAHQLQRDFWSQIPKSVPTRIFAGGGSPVPYKGINFGLYQTLYNRLHELKADAFDLIIVDEAHHALAGSFASCIEHLSPRHLIGMTATPWRGDGLPVESMFGSAIEKISIVDGMKMGYLAQVDYRLMCDNINWKNLSRRVERRISIGDLNRRLFVPQRDEAVISNLLDEMNKVDNPRIAVFSPSIKHAGRFARLLTSSGVPAANLSTPDKVSRRSSLMKFSSGELKAVTSVDVLNEGIDIPDVNILVFLRATHSRRIFVQQLGRGLRIAPGKEKVLVLDFVSDIRRLAAVVEMDRESKAPLEKGKVTKVHMPNGVVTFSDDKARKFIDAWLEDVANLQDLEEAEKLSFPDPDKFSE